MCGIFAVLRAANIDRLKIIKASKLLRHRGPDWSSVLNMGKWALAHERLSIVDVSDNGNQPFLRDDEALIVNGEIYNHKKIRTITKESFPDYIYHSDSDSECIFGARMLYKDDVAFVNSLDGVFAFVLQNTDGGFIIARDAIGVMPLYFGYTKTQELCVASELKALVDYECENINEFPPGHYMTHEHPPRRWYNPRWLTATTFTPHVDFSTLSSLLEKAVTKRMMTDVPFGILLSGGVDSSLVAAIACKHARSRIEDNETTKAWYPQIHTFSVGLANAPDLVNARLVANHLGTIHHEFVIKVQDAIDAISDAVYHLETFDVASIRSGIPMMLLSKKIRAMGFKMVLNGDGADEIFGSYRYNLHAPSAIALHEESKRKVQSLSKYDCLRCNKSMMANSIECRCPYLDKDFVEYVMNIDPIHKMHYVNELGLEPFDSKIMEKYILRKAFYNSQTPFIPDEVLWRTKVQFSTGCGEKLNESLQEYANKNVSDEEFDRRTKVYPVKTPYTKEAYLYRKLFEGHFSFDSLHPDCIPYGKSMNCSTEEALKWKKEWADNWDPCATNVV